MSILPSTYIIYGANSAIGSALANSIVDEVENLVLFYHKNSDKIKYLFTKENVYSISSDIRNYEDFMSKITKLQNEIDIKNIGAVYLPAIRSYDFSCLADTDLGLVRDIIDVNLLGTVHFLKGILKLNKNIHDSRIVLLGSNISRTGLKFGSIYSATKSATANLARTVSQEEGKAGVLINTISPGPVETEYNSFDGDYAQFRKEYFETQKKLTSLDKLASADDVCSLIKYLTSAENKHITGEEIFVTGGAL